MVAGTLPQEAALKSELETLLGLQKREEGKKNLKTILCRIQTYYRVSEVAASSCGFCSDTILCASSYHPVTASQLETQPNSCCTGGVRAASCPCLPAHPSTHRTCFSEGTKMGTNSPLAHAKTVLFWKAATSATFQVCTPELFSASAQAV